MNQLIKGTAILGLALSTVVACEPKDMKVKRPYVNPFAQAKIERAQVNGLDYVQYTAYRLGEVKRLVEFLAQSPAPAVQASGEKACGRLVVDKTEGTRRMLRLQTRECQLASGKIENLSLSADGDELIDVQLTEGGQVSRVWATTVGPYVVSGKIGGKGDLKDSLINARERREFALDLISTAGGVSHYRFTYSIELNWRQELSTKSFKAFEDDGRNQLNLSGELMLKDGIVDAVQLDSGRITAATPREVTDRNKKNKNAPQKTYHNANLLLTAAAGAEKGTLEPLSLASDDCGLPLGKLTVSTYSNSTTDSKEDKLTSKDGRDVEFTALGIRSVANGKTELWKDCRPPANFPLPGGGQSAIPGEKPKLQPGEVGNRTPYTTLFFK